MPSSREIEATNISSDGRSEDKIQRWRMSHSDILLYPISPVHHAFWRAFSAGEARMIYYLILWRCDSMVSPIRFQYE